MLIIPMAVCLFGIYWCMLQEKYISRCIILSTIIGGGLGNLIDRIIHNFTVVDFLNFGIGSLRTGVLNIADLSVTFGVILFVIFDFLLTKNEKNN
jgi:signal peptidase II